MDEEQGEEEGESNSWKRMKAKTVKAEEEVR